MASTGDTWRLGRRPALDGLRGVAVLLVIADHAGFLPEPTGSIGVTLFFALSGFLITRLLIEGRSVGGRLLREFYLNRIARLVPALLVMVGVVSAVLVVAGATPAWVAWRAVPAVLYVQNYMPSMDYPIFGHTWSLAVEEQFYLLWPLVLPALLRARRPLLWLGSAATCSIVLWVAAGGAALPMHAYGLLAGGALALVVHRLHEAPWHVGLVGGAGILLAVGVAGGLPAESPWARLVATPFAVLLVWTGLRGGWLLRSRLLRFTGRCSYALYLWHLPLLALAGENHGRLAALPVLGVAALVAVASTLLLEEPIRQRRRTRQRRPDVPGATSPVLAVSTPPI